MFQKGRSVEDHKEIQDRFIWLNAFFRSYYSFTTLSKHCKELDKMHGDLYPFTHLQNVLLYDTVINWCKIFGVDREDCHWKRLVKNHDHFRKYLFSKLGKNKKEFSEYHSKMIDFRNKWVVHFDPKHTHNVVPYFEIAHDSAVILHSYLKEQTEDNFEYNGPDSIIDFGEKVSDVMFQKLLQK